MPELEKTPDPGDSPGTRRPAGSGGRGYWNLLLLIPILLPLLSPLYNTKEPQLFGLPFFYWFLLALIPLLVVVTVVVYLLTKPRS
ncbi:DUF3311 domain-containing protein [Fodinicola acaciae]|uniref:DUF3311 domain-containing protein n=1 Tax=Fodinicola acaciae TaxID=2681555 RepID=UPI001C9E4516|nr:DUF3311 domain-containing protein [Fodinicola acaciae]